MDESYDFAVQKKAILGTFDREYKHSLDWFPNYIKEFPNALNGVDLEWKRYKFISDVKELIPDKHGVYCFVMYLGHPFPQEICVPLYVGKAAPRFLSERFNDYLKERKNYKGREKIVLMLNLHKNDLWFFYTELPRIYIDTVEEHLLMCLRPPCNTIFPKTERLWGKAFD